MAEHPILSLFLAEAESGTREIDLARKGKPHDHALLVAAVNAARDIAIDTSEHGGMVSAQTEISFDTLDKAIRAAGGRDAA